MTVHTLTANNWPISFSDTFRTFQWWGRRWQIKFHYLPIILKIKRHTTSEELEEEVCFSFLFWLLENFWELSDVENFSNYFFSTSTAAVAQMCFKWTSFVSGIQRIEIFMTLRRDKSIFAFSLVEAEQLPLMTTWPINARQPSIVERERGEHPVWMWSTDLGGSPLTACQNSWSCSAD